MGGRLQAKVALITGGASGIGRAVAERYGAEGAQVAVFDRNADRLAAFADAFPAVQTIAGDVRDMADLERAVAAVLDRCGRLDILVANAGVWDWNARLADMPAEGVAQAFDELFAINVRGYLLAAKAALPALVASGGTIIFTLSNAALYTNGGGPLYTASRHATLGLMRQLAFELAPRIRVNGVAVGGLETDLRGIEAMGQGGQSIASMPLAVAAPLVMPIARQPSVAEATGSYVFLADPRDAGAITGAVIEAHGGVGIRGYLKPAGGYDLDPAGDPTPAAMAALQAAMAGPPPSSEENGQ